MIKKFFALFVGFLLIWHSLATPLLILAQEDGSGDSSDSDASSSDTTSSDTSTFESLGGEAPDATVQGSDVPEPGSTDFSIEQELEQLANSGGSEDAQDDGSTNSDIIHDPDSQGDAVQRFTTASEDQASETSGNNQPAETRSGVDNPIGQAWDNFNGFVRETIEAAGNWAGSELTKAGAGLSSSTDDSSASQLADDAQDSTETSFQQEQQALAAAQTTQGDYNTLANIAQPAGVEVSGGPDNFNLGFPTLAFGPGGVFTPSFLAE